MTDAEQERDRIARLVEEAARREAEHADRSLCARYARAVLEQLLAEIRKGAGAK